MANQLPPQKQAEIIKLHLAGMNNNRISVEMKISKDTVISYVRKHYGIPKPKLESYTRKEIKPHKFVNEYNRNSGIPDYLI